MNKVTLLFLVLAVSVILTVFVHFSLSTGTTETTTAAQYQANEVANAGSAHEEPTGNTTNIETYFNNPQSDDRISYEQPEKGLCRDAGDSTGSRGQVSNVPSNENVSIPTPLPDGRIFACGEPPYGYLPTCGPKDRDMPFVPVEPD